jgi:hypothetical protein
VPKNVHTYTEHNGEKANDADWVGNTRTKLCYAPGNAQGTQSKPDEREVGKTGNRAGKVRKPDRMQIIIPALRVHSLEVGHGRDR